MWSLTTRYGAPGDVKRSDERYSGRLSMLSLFLIGWTVVRDLYDELIFTPVS